MAIDWRDHPTSHAVRKAVRREANFHASERDVTWNTYYDHPVGYHLDDVSVDFWGTSGRGDAIKTEDGNEIVRKALNRLDIVPVAWLIWRGRIWYPYTGWSTYSGWSGLHYDHVHITFNLYSRTAGKWPLR